MSCAKKYSARRQGSNVMREGIVPLSSIIDIYCLNLAHGDCPMKMKDFYVLCTKSHHCPIHKLLLSKERANKPVSGAHIH